ncbi:MAG: STAS domain-containing protein [Planctomycetota bacterium]|jgi:anti-anti-sigma factor
MRIKTQDYNEVTVIKLQGELDGELSEKLQHSVTNLISSSKKGIVIDMGDVGFVNSEGLECLLWTRDYSNENHCQFRLAGLDENCEKILEITRLENEFDRYVEVAEAVKSFA